MPVLVADPPRRIQLRRAKGWRKPPGSVVVTRASKVWGNPYRVEVHGRADAIRLYREHLLGHPDLVDRIRAELAEKTLACWCRLDQDCHADLLLRIAAGEPW